MNSLRVRASALLLALLLLVAACGSTQTPGASPSAPPEGSPDASASPSAPPSASPSASPDEAVELTWERLEIPPLGDNSVIVDVEAAGPGFVALAISGPSGSTILTSPDGRGWTAVPQAEWAYAGLVSMVRAADGRLIAVGRDTTDVDTDIAMVWISDDGVDWRRAPGGPDLEGAQLIDVVETDAGFVAIGGYPTQDAAGAWTSPDGEIWTRAAPTDSFQHAFVWAVAEGGPGLVAVGWRRNDGPTGFDPAFWTSVDGTEWTLAPTPDGAAGAQVRDVTRIGNAMVAVGDDLLTGGQAFAWVSTDGSSWETVGATDTFEGASLADVAATPGGFVALGGRNMGDGGVWISADGRAWTVLDDPIFADASLADALAVGDDVMIVGNTQERIAGTESYTWHPMIWYGSPRP